jgi:hypothetical protein
MSRKYAVLAVMIAATVIAKPWANAQDSKNELTGVIGRIFISSQKITGPDAPSINPAVNYGKGLTFEVNYSRRLLSVPVFAISAELPAVFNLDEKLGSGGNDVPKSYKQIFVTPAVRVNLFPLTSVSPWVSLGGGVAHFTESDELNYYGTNPGGSSTSGVLEAGVGLDMMPFSKHFRNVGFRGQFRDFWSGTPELPLADTGKTRQHNYFLGGGVIFRF